MPAMNVLVIGSGGREHALGWKLKQSPRCGKLFFTPGNGGTSFLGTNVALFNDKVDTKTVDAIDYFCRQNQVELIVIGPEDPLAAGLADRLAKPGRTVFGPVAAAARLEADKAYCKQLLRNASIPTAEARIFTNHSAALAYVQSRETPVVVKAAGLAKGKGVVVCDDAAQAQDAVNLIMRDHAFGEAGDTIVVEERLVGQEVSLLALVDGRNIFVLEPAQDHKQIGEGDVGPNTGGMGSYSPTPLIDDALMAVIESQILVPTVDALRREGVEYRGVLYAGLMLTAGGPKVLEFNCRFGDPETQTLMLRLKGDLLEIMLAVAGPGPSSAGQGSPANWPKLDEVDLSWDPRCSVCVVMASGGYPGDYKKGIPITGIEAANALEGVRVFHAGTTTTRDGTLVTAGGRVLNVCAVGADLKEAQARANAACAKIHFEGAQYRRDIGFRVMK
ncbi:MAG: phosphoribosylamine--glycine ligase [Planctomycetota bacterium]|nr:phosphoribosylamine--glycine ligase [Planctomycetota bacterium]